MELSGTRTQDQVGPRLTATMPKKKTYNFGHPKNKKKQKNKPTPPGEGAKEEKTEDHGEGCSSSDTASGHERSSAEVEKPVAAGESLGDRNVQPTMFKQVEIPGKGQGLVATAHLPVGTIVFQESPLISAEAIDGLFPHDVKEIVSKFRRLTDEQKNQVLSLHDPGPTSLQGKNLPNACLPDETEEKAVRIFVANCINLCGHQEMNITKSGLYMTISRVNHSCAPNVVWSWIEEDESRSVKEVRVCRKINEGEEILASYIPSHEIFPSKDDRHTMLRNWNFTCNCEVCSLTGDELIENEKAREKISYLHKAVVVEANFGSMDQAYEAAKEKLKIMSSIEKEMILQLPTALMECCEMAAHCNLTSSSDEDEDEDAVPSSSTAELMGKAKDMSKLFGDCFVYNYQKKTERISMIRLYGDGGDGDCRLS